MYDLLVKNGKIVTAEAVECGNIAVQNDKIAAILTEGEEPEAAKVIDAKGMYVFPGAIDTHAHLNDPGYEWREDYEHGTAAAAVGGYTTIVDMPLQNEPAMTNAELFDIKNAKVGPNAYVDYCFWGGLIPDNFDDLKGLDEKGCVAFKSFIGPVSPDYSSLNYGQAYEAMQIIKEFDGRAGFHCEDFATIKWQEQRMKKEGRMDWQGFLDSRPVIAEMLATVNIIEIAKATGCKAHICHVSSPDVAQKIKEAQQEGYDITAETCTHYLSMTDQDVIANGPLFKCAPPLRSQEEVDRLWSYVEDGTFSGIASDHSPCSYDESFMKFWVRRSTMSLTFGAASAASRAVCRFLSMKAVLSAMFVQPFWQKLWQRSRQRHSVSMDRRAIFALDLMRIWLFSIPKRNGKSQMNPCCM